MEKQKEKLLRYSIKGECRSEIKIRRSVFICSLGHVESPEEARQFIARISKENKGATHNCWAYVLGEQAETFHSSDAGEPSGTAGKPMLNTLQKNKMTWVAAVVTRHFGGVKLGVRGLIEAYGASVQDAIDKAPLVKQIQSVEMGIEVSYEFNDTLLSLIKKDLVCIKETAYTQKVVHRIDIAKASRRRVVEMLEQYQAMGKLTFILEDREH